MYATRRRQPISRLIGGVMALAAVLAGSGGPARPAMASPGSTAGTLSAAGTPAAAGTLPATNALAPVTPQATCSAFVVVGNPRSTTGATWTYNSTDGGVRFALEGVLFVPATGTGTRPAVVISHGKGGTARGYSATIARTMVTWGLVAIGTTYTHAPDAEDAGNAPDGPDGASAANVQRARKTRDLLSCVGEVDLTRVAAHGHSMGAFVTGQLLGTHPGDFRAASHTAGGVSDGPNATKPDAAGRIVTPYQLHHGDADTVVSIGQDRTLARILATTGTPHELHVYAGYDHQQITFDTRMLSRVHAWYQAYGMW